MSKPIRCATCGELVGLHNALFVTGRKWGGNCPGRGKHPKPEQIIKRHFHGLWETVTQRWPETGSVSVWNRTALTGAALKFATQIAPEGRLYSTVKNEWCFR